MEQFYRTLVKSQSQKIGSAIPFVVLLQQGYFCNVYGTTADHLHEVLGLKVIDVPGKPHKAGFPMVSIDTWTEKLVALGYGVCSVLQLENTDTKRVRLDRGDGGKETQRTISPLETACFFQERPLAIVQGEQSLIYFVTSNEYIEYDGNVLEKLMHHDPVEILCSDDELVRSLRTLFPKAVLRTQFPNASSPLQTLRSYLTKTSHVAEIENLRRSEHHTTRFSLRMDARTIQNLTLFGSQRPLFKALNKCKTHFGAVRLRTSLFTPSQDRPSIIQRQTEFKTALAVPQLGMLYQRMPKKLILANSRHPLYRTELAKIVQTASSLKKWRAIIEGAVAEIVSWNQWASDCAACGLSLTTCSVPAVDALVLPSPTSFSEQFDELVQKQPFQCRWSKSNFLETNVKNEHLVRTLPDSKILKKTKTTVQFDTRDVQRLRLAFLEDELNYHVVALRQVKDWVSNFKESYRASMFEGFADLDRIVSTAHWYDSHRESWCWPDFVDGPFLAQNVTLPKYMTDGRSLVPNDVESDQFVLYGHNGSGKSTYMKAVGINLLLAHCGLPVFASAFRTPVRDAIHLRFGSNDSLAEGKSSFDVEMEHAHHIVTTATSRSAVFCDELGCSCDVPSGEKICHWYLDRFKDIGCFLIFATHFDIAQAEGRQFKEMGGEFKVTVAGDERTRNAVKIAEECGVPASVLYIAETILKH